MGDNLSTIGTDLTVSSVADAKSAFTVARDTGYGVDQKPRRVRRQLVRKNAGFPWLFLRFRNKRIW
jgi:hypothetical protein